MKAHQVLDDCRIVLSKLERSDEESEFRVNWVTMVTMLRTVGHVLAKVDGQQNEVLENIIKIKWCEWKANKEKNKIFWQFIETERNTVLKTYEPSYNPIGVNYVVYMGEPENVFYSDEGELSLGIPNAMLEASTLDSGVYRPILGGPFAWEDACRLAGEAIQWWSHQLTEIDAQLRGRA